MRRRHCDQCAREASGVCVEHERRAEYAREDALGWGYPDDGPDFGADPWAYDRSGMFGAAGAVPVALTVTVGGVAAWLVLTAALTAAFGPSAAALALAVTALTGGAFVLGRAVGREDATVELGDWPAPVAAQIGGDQ